MPKLLLLALCLVGCTLTVPALVWAISTSWREALNAWFAFSAWIGGMLLLGAVVWLIMPTP